MAKRKDAQQPGRRAFVKKAAYVAPAILSLAATPSHATVGSYKPVPTPGRITPPRKGR